MTLKNLSGFKALFCIIFLFFYCQLYSQNDEFRKFNLKIKKSFNTEKGYKNYIAPYLLLKDDTSNINMVNQIKYQYYSYIHKGDFDVLSFSKKRLNDSRIKFIRANKVILNMAKREKVTMFNEQHEKPINRLYITTLLDSFRRRGYGVLALETLSWKDTILNQRKFPISSSGVYIVEPYFANLVRVALELGYKVLPYETQNFTNFTLASREKSQASNLAKIINSQKDKVLVLAGFSHISEIPIKSGLKEIKWMAKYLKDEFEIDPLTIDQTELLSDHRINKISIPCKNGSTYVTPELLGKYDLTLVYPKKSILNYLQIKLGKRRIKVQLNKKYVGKNQLIQFYIKEEYENYKNNAIPYEQFLIEDSEMNIYLNPKRKYELIIRGNDYGILFKKTIHKTKEITIY